MSPTRTPVSLSQIFTVESFPFETTQPHVPGIMAMHVIAPLWAGIERICSPVLACNHVQISLVVTHYHNRVVIGELCDPVADESENLLIGLVASRSHMTPPPDSSIDVSSSPSSLKAI